MTEVPGPGRREQVLRVLRDSPAPLRLHDLAQALGVHPNTVRFHVERLLRSGQVEQVVAATRGTGRPPAHYRAVPRMDPTGPRRYGMLAGILVEALEQTSERRDRALAAGRAWGRRIAEDDVGADHSSPTQHPDGLDRLVAVMREAGFAPELRATRTEIALRHCPFLELAQTRGDVVCPVHLGLMQGVLEQLDADITATRLDPFVEPDLCVAHLGARGGQP